MMTEPIAVTWAAMMPVLPELLLIGVAVTLIGLDLFAPEQRLLPPWLTVIGCLVALGMILGAEQGSAFGGMFLADGYAMVFKTICLVGVIVTALMSERFCHVAGIRPGELYGLMVLSLTGMMVMASAGDLMSLYLGMELMALPIYALVGLHKEDRRTSEAAVKYFLMGSFASALLLFGMSLLYGLTGTTAIESIAELIADTQLANNPALMAALALLLAGFCFKVAVAPFHLWTPDVYEGAPTIVTAFMSVAAKAAGFAIFGRVLFMGVPQLYDQWGLVLAVLAVLTMAVGNFTALCQRSLKRMLAYSAVAHAGYALLGLLSGTAEGLTATVSYLFIYLFMNLGAFAVLMLQAAGPDRLNEDLDDIRGLAGRSPVAAALMLVFMFSLTGIPPTAGFIGKFYLLKSAFMAGYSITVVLAVLFSAISAYFYLRVVRYMYMSESEAQGGIRLSPGMSAALGLCLLAVIGLGLFPGGLLDWAATAISG